MHGAIEGDPELRAWLGSHGVEKLVVGNQDHAVWSERNPPVCEHYMVAGLQVVVQPPKRAEDVLVIPMRAPAEVPDLMYEEFDLLRLRAERQELHPSTRERAAVGSQLRPP